MLFLTEDNDFAGDSQVSKPKAAPYKPDAPLSMIVKNHLTVLTQIFVFHVISVFIQRRKFLTKKLSS
jgi:hypothetical protein